MRRPPPLPTATLAMAMTITLGVLLMTSPRAPGQTHAAEPQAPKPSRVAPSAADSHGLSPHLKNAQGEWRWTNRLARESSPYLLQHAHNPVDWRPWGPEAFEAAKTSGKPIFLSIGYATCYWCHVMERQCFEDETIARQMNELFICIKVDREERPDVDDLYMTATQLMTGAGGWPMSVFLTPPTDTDRGLKPFWAGTYIPPAPLRGRPGFPQLMAAIHDAWSSNRPEVLAVADRAAQAVTQHLGAARTPTDPDPAAPELAVRQLMRAHDPVHGGFGDAPKFPTPNNLRLLLAAHHAQPRPELAQALSLTLDRMARGGMYDQIAGGFHRYSTDERWLVPHFEKMLYDNAQLVDAYLDAHALLPQGDEPGFHARIARETCDYILREMVDDSGAFWSAQDAEVDHVEGGSYTWTPAQVHEALAHDPELREFPELRELALLMYGLNQGPNFRDPHQADAEPVNVLHLPLSLPSLAAAQGAELSAISASKRRIDAALLAHRDARPQPGTDDKALLAWNGMMIGALARAGRELNEPRYTAAASHAADALLSLQARPDGSLHRTLRKGHARIEALLEDYAFFAHGLALLHEAMPKGPYLPHAQRLAELAIQRFGDPAGGYYDTLDQPADLFVRPRSRHDGAVPSGNAQMAHLIIELFRLTREPRWADRLRLDLRAGAPTLRDIGAGAAHLHHALLRARALCPQALEPMPTSSPRDTPAPTVTPPAPARQAQPVAVRVEPQAIDLSAGPVKVRLALTIAPGFHLMASDPARPKLVGLSLKLEDAAGVVLTDIQTPPGQPKALAFEDQPVRVIEGDATLEATLRPVSGHSGPRRGTLVLRYQACDERACQKPRDIEVPLSLR